MNLLARPIIKTTLRLSLATLSAAACATTGPPSRGPAQQQVDAAQIESQSAYTRAAQAQRDAGAKSVEAGRAEDDARAKQADAQRASARARQLRADAIEAQRRAIREGELAQQQSLGAQHRALDAQPDVQAQSQARGISMSARGKVQRSATDELVIGRDNAPALRLKILDHETTITRDGRSLAADDLLPGTEVMVTYRIERDQPIAQLIEADPAPQIAVPGPTP